jgi:hypothetical protein
LLGCRPYKELPTILAKKEELGEFRAKLEKDGMKKENAKGLQYYEVNFKIGMTFDSTLKFYLKFKDSKCNPIVPSRQFHSNSGVETRSMLEADLLDPESRPPISNRS